MFIACPCGVSRGAFRCAMQCRLLKMFGFFLIVHPNGEHHDACGNRFFVREHLLQLLGEHGQHKLASHLVGNELSPECSNEDVRSDVSDWLARAFHRTAAHFCENVVGEVLGKCRSTKFRKWLDRISGLDKFYSVVSQEQSQEEHDKQGHRKELQN